MGGAVRGIFVSLIGGSTVTMFGSGLGIFKTGMLFVEGRLTLKVYSSGTSSIVIMSLSLCKLICHHPYVLATFYCLEV